jgi:hypothetical protein
LGGVTHFYNRRLFISISSTGNTKTPTYNFNYTFNDGLWIYPVTQCILHGQRLDSIQETELLDSLYSVFVQAPENGPCININNQNPDCDAGKGWRGQNRWFGNKDTRDTITDTNNHPADHNGLDYMLAYNLYRMYANPAGYYNTNQPFVPTSLPFFAAKKNNIRLYPNPVADMISVEYALPAAKTVSVSLYDLTGRLVLSEKNMVWHPSGEYRENISVGGLPANTYILLIQLDGEIFREKVIVF